MLLWNYDLLSNLMVQYNITEDHELFNTLLEVNTTLWKSYKT